MTTEQLKKFQDMMGVRWYNALLSTFQSKEFNNLGNFLANEGKQYNIYPSPTEKVFRAFTLTHLEDVRVVICGQNSYHTKDIADGLAFSCSNQKTPQPSLCNIIQEVETQVYNNNIDMMKPEYYDLARWAKQGVFLLNCGLTVREGQPDSHIEQWKFFIHKVIEILNNTHTGLVYLLWGVHAKSLTPLIGKNNYILTCGHPMTKTYKDSKDTWSNNGHFIKTNEILKSSNNIEIQW